MNNSKILTIIPARKGSKGVPGKNIQTVGGKPLIFWTIKAALSSGVIDKLIVSTDGEDIAEISKECGAEVIMRPEKLSSDSATTESAMGHVLEVLKAKNYIPDFISLIQCTSPFLSSDIIQSCVKKVTDIEQGFDSCITVFRPDGYEFKWRKTSKDECVPEHNVFKRPRRQDLNIPYHENGAFYITKTHLFEETGNRFGGDRAKVTAVEMGEVDSLQIDSHDHLLIADILMEHRLNSN